MKVQINATGWNLSRDTESHEATTGIVSFLNDFKIPYERKPYVRKDHSHTPLPQVDTVVWHESVSIVDIPCETVAEIREYCTKYDAKIEIQDETALITFL